MLKPKSDSRRIMFSIPLLLSLVVAAATIQCTYGATSSTYYPNNYSITTGSHKTGAVPSSVQTVDSDYFIAESSPSGTSSTPYNPSAYNMLANTSYVSGSTAELISNDDNYTIFRSGSSNSSQTLFAHQTNTTIGGETYNDLRLYSADDFGTRLSASAGSTGRKLMGKFVYQLTSLLLLPASTWTIYYRVLKDQGQVAAHADVDVLIRMSDGSVRATVATDVANSGALTTSWSTLYGNYSWSNYLITDQTDYLEIDYYITVTNARAGTSVHLGIDDGTLFTAQQTRLTNIRLLDENAVEVEFDGSSDLFNWNELNWSVDCAWTIPNVTVAIQLFNFTSGAYATHGGGFIAYNSSAAADLDETKTQIIATDLQSFQDASGNWRIKVKGVKDTRSQFDLKVDWIEFKPSHYSEYTVSTEFIFSSIVIATPIQLDLTVVSQYTTTGINATIQFWNYTSSTYPTNGQACIQYQSNGANETKQLNITIDPQSYISNGNAKIRLSGKFSTTNSFQQETNQILLIYSYNLPNQPPRMDTITEKSVNEFELLNFTATASDPDTAPENLTFSLGPGAPAGASITTNGVFTWIPSEEQGPGNYTIRILVSDGALTDYKDFSVAVHEAHTHDVSVVSVSAIPTEVQKGKTVNVTVTVKNQGTATETFNVTLFCNGTLLGTQAVINLSPSAQAELKFEWNTSAFAEAYYMLHAVASSVHGEIDVSNNAGDANLIKVVSTTAPIEPPKSISFDWFKVLLFGLPVLLGVSLVLFLFVLRPRRKSKTEQEIVPQLENNRDLFSQQFGKTHDEIAGEKILLEIDPESDYNKSLSSFVSEVINNNELLVILTNRNSALHSYFSGTTNVVFLLLTTKVSTYEQLKNNEILLPTNDLSIVLDAFSKMKIQVEQQMNLVFDNLSDLIVNSGFERTYSFTRELLETIATDKITALFVFNPMAHDPEIASSVRGLFHTQLAYAKSGTKVGIL